MRVLIIDDEAAVGKTTRGAAEEAGHTVVEAPNRARAVKTAEEEHFEAAFLDLVVESQGGLRVLEQLLKAQPGILVAVVAADATAALDAVRLGAFDFVQKPLGSEAIRVVLAKMEKRLILDQRVRSLEAERARSVPPIDLDSEEPAVKLALEAAFKAAPTQAAVLLLGPSGTGKSTLAREIHQRSARSGAAFVTVSCPSVSNELLQSELFGQAKDSINGLAADSVGKVAAAAGGTLFLEEIGEMPLEIQSKLLRLLQTQEYERIGEARTRRSDVRIITATRRDLAEEVRAGRFREDLFHRLNVASVVLPALHERPGDVARVADGYLRFFCARLGKQVAGFSPAVSDAFARYRWPGNLRELSNIIERAVMLTTGPSVALTDLPEGFGWATSPAVSVGAHVTIDEVETEHIRRILSHASSLDDAARTLGINPATLYRKRQKLGLLERVSGGGRGG